jgi:Zn-dependent peptidase ImmA (M78 family)/transcriptional regulator with XRE-family HTH domain
VANVDAKSLGERIRAARKRAGLSQDDLAREIGLDRSAVNRLEAGARKVTALELSDIATAVDVRMSTFFEDPLPSLMSHRSSQGLDTADSQIDALLAKLADEVEFVNSLESTVLGLDSADAVAQAKCPPPSTNAEAEVLAARARGMMGLETEAPILRLSEEVAKIGLLAFSRDIGKDTADAGTILLRRGAVALINSHLKVGHRRLALAHELGHYLIADDYTVDWQVAGHSDQTVPMESRLDRFARTLLLPGPVLARKWPELVERLGERAAAVTLASEFRVNMATLAARLTDAGLADQDTVAAVRLLRTTKADMVELGLFVPLEELLGTTVPRSFSRAVLKLVRDERISRERALDLLQGTFSDTDLPVNRERRADEIWKYVW